MTAEANYLYRKSFFRSWWVQTLSIEQWWANCGPWANSGLILVFVNTAVLQHAYNHSFKQSMEYFHDTKIELSSCSRDCVAHKAYNIYYMAFIEHILWPPLYTSAVWNASLWIVSYKCMMKGRAGARMQTKSLFPLSSNSCYEKNKRLSADLDSVYGELIYILLKPLIYFQSENIQFSSRISLWVSKDVLKISKQNGKIRCIF